LNKPGRQLPIQNTGGRSLFAEVFLNFPVTPNIGPFDQFEGGKTDPVQANKTPFFSHPEVRRRTLLQHANDCLGCLVKRQV
jgi:hypothetical protein